MERREHATNSGQSPDMTVRFTDRGPRPWSSDDTVKCQYDGSTPNTWQNIRTDDRVVLPQLDTVRDGLARVLRIRCSNVLLSETPDGPGLLDTAGCDLARCPCVGVKAVPGRRRSRRIILEPGPTTLSSPEIVPERVTRLPHATVEADDFQHGARVIAHDRCSRARVAGFRRGPGVPR